MGTVPRSDEKSRICEICGNEMTFFYGCHWDYDTFYCVPQFRGGGCGHNVELDSTTCPDEDEPQTQE